MLSGSCWVLVGFLLGFLLAACWVVVGFLSGSCLGLWLVGFRAGGRRGGPCGHAAGWPHRAPRGLAAAVVLSGCCWARVLAPPLGAVLAFRCGGLFRAGGCARAAFGLAVLVVCAPLRSGRAGPALPPRQPPPPSAHGLSSGRGAVVAGRGPCGLRFGGCGAPPPCRAGSWARGRCSSAVCRPPAVGPSARWAAAAAACGLPLPPPPPRCPPVGRGASSWAAVPRSAGGSGGGPRCGPRGGFGRPPPLRSARAWPVSPVGAWRRPSCGRLCGWGEAGASFLVSWPSVVGAIWLFGLPATMGLGKGKGAALRFLAFDSRGCLAVWLARNDEVTTRYQHPTPTPPPLGFPSPPPHPRTPCGEGGGAEFAAAAIYAATNMGDYIKYGRWHRLVFNIIPY